MTLPAKDTYPIRDKALLELYATGCRASEVSDLTLGNLHLESAYCLYQGKGGKQRLVPLAPRAIQTLQEYLTTERPMLVNAGSFESADDP